MAELKTRPTGESVSAFLEGVEDEGKRKDSLTVLEIMRDVTGAEPTMWGGSIVGFGSHHYRYESGREGDWFQIGFSPRKRYLTLYLMGNLDAYGDVLARLGKHRRGKGCLYITKLQDVDLGVLRELVERSVADLAETHAIATSPGAT